MNNIQSYGMVNYQCKNNAVTFGNKDRLSQIASDYAARKAKGLDDVTNKYVAGHSIHSGIKEYAKDGMRNLTRKLTQAFRKPANESIANVKGLKTSLERKQLTDLQVKLIEDAKVERVCK